MAEKTFGLAVSEVGTARGRVASFSAAPYGTGTTWSGNPNLISFAETLWSDVFFHRLFLNVFLWCVRFQEQNWDFENTVYITDPENKFIRTYFDGLAGTFQGGNWNKQSFGIWSGSEVMSSITNGGLDIEWTDPWYEPDTSNLNTYDRALCHIILPSSNAKYGLRMPDERQAEIIRNVADMSANAQDQDSQNNRPNDFYNANSPDFRGCGLITFEWFHYLQKVRPGGAFTIQDPNNYVELYSPDDVVHRGMAKSASQLVHTVSGVYDLTPIDIDNNPIILSAAESIRYSKTKLDIENHFYQSLEDTLGLGVPDIIELEPTIETESYDASMSRLAVLKNNELVKSEGIYITNVRANVVATTTTTTTTTTTREPGEETKVAVGGINILESCGPYDMSITGRDAEYFLLENNIIYLVTTNVPVGVLKIDILLEDHFRPKRFEDVKRPFEIEFDQCKAPIVANRTANSAIPAYSYRPPQSEDFSEEFDIDVTDYLWSVTRPSLSITPFTDYNFTGEGTEDKPFKVCLGGGHYDANTFWMKFQDYVGFGFPYTVNFKITSNASVAERWFLWLNEDVSDHVWNLDMEADNFARLQFVLNNTVTNQTDIIDPDTHNGINIFKEVTNEFRLFGISPLTLRNDVVVSLTDPAGGGGIPVEDGDISVGVDYIYGTTYKQKVNLTVPAGFSNPSPLEEDEGKSVLWIYQPNYNRCILKVYVNDVVGQKPKQHLRGLDFSSSFDNSIAKYLDIPNKGTEITGHYNQLNYNSSVIQMSQAWINRGETAWIPNDANYTLNPFKEREDFYLKAWYLGNLQTESATSRQVGVPVTGIFKVKGPAHGAVNLVFGYQKDYINTTGNTDRVCLELVVNPSATTTTPPPVTTSTTTTTTTSTTTLPPEYCFEVEVTETNPITDADVLDGTIAPFLTGSATVIGDNDYSLQICGQRETLEGEEDRNVVYRFKYEANEGHYYQIKPTLIGPVESNPEVDEMVYETEVTINNDRQGGEVRVTMKRFPPIGPLGTRKFIKFYLSGQTIPTTTTTTTTPTTTTTTTTTTTPPPCNNLIDILCKQTLRCTYNSFTGECDTQVISHEIVAETCCQLSDSVINAKVNNYLDLNPSLRSTCLNNTTAYAPCNDPNDDNECETTVEEFSFIASISCE